MKVYRWLWAHYMTWLWARGINCLGNSLTWYFRGKYLAGLAWVFCRMMSIGAHVESWILLGFYQRFNPYLKDWPRHD